MIKKVVNGEAKAVNRIYKRSNNLFNEDKLADAQSGAISYDKRKKTLTITDSYSTNLKLKLKYCAPDLEVGKTYVLTFNTTATNNSIWINFPGTNGSTWTSGRPRTITKDDLDSNIFLYGVKGETHTLSKFQIVEGTEIKPYVPYLLDIYKVKKVVDVTDQMTNSVGNPFWNAENQEWTGANKEYCYVGNVVGIIDKYGLQKYVIEFDARTDAEGRVSVYDTGGNDYKYTFINEIITCKKEWQHYKFTGKAKLGVDGGYVCYISFYSEYGTGVIPHVKNFKIRTAVDVFTHVTSEVADGVVEVNPAKVSDGVLEIKGDNVKVENNKLIIL